MKRRNENFFIDNARQQQQEAFSAKLHSFLTVFFTIIGCSIVFCMTPPGHTVLSNIMAGKVSGPQMQILPFLARPQNILIMGVDSNGKHSDPFKGTRTDTMLLVNINPVSKSVSAISIPRDSKVYIAEDNGLTKINAAHAIGGPKLAIKTIQNTLGVNIDHYVVISFDGVKEIVDAMGGVPINIEKRMKYTDRSGGLYVNLQPGYQVLDGDAAEQYLRFRHDAVGDIGRMKRQQWFVQGIAKQFQSPSIIPKIPQIVTIASKYIKTDMSFYQLTQYAAYIKSIDMSKMQVATLPGGPSEHGRISYWILDTEKTQDIIDKLIYREKAPVKESPYTVSLLYARGLKNSADMLKGQLETSGYEVKCSGIAKDPHPQILGHSEYASVDIADKFKVLAPELSQAPYISSPNNHPCGATDFSIILTQQLAQ